MSKIRYKLIKKKRQRKTSNDSSNVLQVIEDIPFSSIRNCESSKEVSEVVSKYL